MKGKNRNEGEPLAVIEIKKIKIKRWLILGLFLFLFFIFIARIKGILFPFIAAFILAYVVNPLIKKLDDKGVQRVVSILIVFTMVFSLIMAFIVFAFPIIVDELDNLARSLPVYFREMEDFFNQLNRRYSQVQLPPSVRQVIEQGFVKLEERGMNLIEGITQVILNVVSRLLTLLIVPVLAFYFLKDREKFGEAFWSLVPHSYRKDVQQLAEEVNRVFSGFLRGQMVISLIVGILTTLSLYFLGIKFHLILGLMAGIFNIIPYLGPILGAIPPVLFALLQGPWKALLLLIVLTVIQQVESGLIAPKVMSAQVGLHPVTVIFALFAGGELFGLLGLILAVPIFGIIKVILTFTWNKLVEER